MTTITPTTAVYDDGGADALIITWTPLGVGDDGAGVTRSSAADRTVQVIGTAAGATLTFQGSNNGTDWATLHDPQGNDLAFTSVGIKAISEATYYVRPIVSGGAGTSFTVILFAKVAS